MTAEVEARVVVAIRGRGATLSMFGVASGVSHIARRRSSSSRSAGFSEPDSEVVDSGVDVGCSTGSGSICSGSVDVVGSGTS